MADACPLLPPAGLAKYSAAEGASPGKCRANSCCPLGLGGSPLSHISCHPELPSLTWRPLGCPCLRHLWESRVTLCPWSPRPSSGLGCSSTTTSASGSCTTSGERRHLPPSAAALARRRDPAASPGLGPRRGGGRRGGDALTPGQEPSTVPALHLSPALFSVPLEFLAFRPHFSMKAAQGPAPEQGRPGERVPVPGVGPLTVASHGPHPRRLLPRPRGLVWLFLNDNSLLSVTDLNTFFTITLLGLSSQTLVL